jgi:hypothetical protein
VLQSIATGIEFGVFSPYTLSVLHVQKILYNFDLSLKRILLCCVASLTSLPRSVFTLVGLAGARSSNGEMAGLLSFLISAIGGPLVLLVAAALGSPTIAVRDL